MTLVVNAINTHRRAEERPGAAGARLEARTAAVQWMFAQPRSAFRFLRALPSPRLRGLGVPAKPGIR